MAEETKSLIAQPKAFTLPPTPELAAVSGQVGGIPGVADFEKRGKEFKTSGEVGAEQGRILQQLGGLEEQIGGAQAAAKQYELAASADIARQTRESAQDIEAGLDLIRERFPHPQFHPTQENTQSMATLFSLMGLVGVAMGGSGKMSAMNSLKSMTGMLQGWQQGRKDLFEREKVEFDKNMARTKAILDDAYRDADRAYKTLAYNREEAQALAAQSAAKLGGQVGKQILEKQGIERYFSYLDGIKKDLKEAEKLASQERIADKKEEAARIRQEALFAQQNKLAIEREAAAERRLERRLAAAPQRAADRYGFGDIIATASNEAAASLSNLVQMPFDVTSGIFGGRTTTSLFTAPLDTLINTAITAEDTQRYNAEISNFGKFVAQVQKGGRMVTNADIEKTSQAFRVEEGDKPLTKLTKLAQARQALERALEVRIASPNTPPELKEVYRQNQRDITQAVPFTVKDVNAFANQRDKNKTFSQSFGEYGMGGEGAQRGPQEGATATSKSGKPMIFRNGNWEYK